MAPLQRYAMCARENALDGVESEGIDALVEALVANPANEVVVCAPESNRSGSGDMTIRVWDFDGNYAECAIFATDPNGVADVVAGNVDEPNPVSSPNDLLNCTEWTL